jgi:hypothetical protein
MSSYGPATAYSVGMIHGVGAETGTQVLLIAAIGGAAGQGFGIPMMIAFVVGLVISNTILVVISATGFVRSQNRQRIYIAVGVLAGIFSIIVGTIFLLGQATLPDQGLLTRPVSTQPATGPAGWATVAIAPRPGPLDAGADAHRVLAHGSHDGSRRRCRELIPDDPSTSPNARRARGLAWFATAASAAGGFHVPPRGSHLTASPRRRWEISTRQRRWSLPPGEPPSRRTFASIAGRCAACRVGLDPPYSSTVGTPRMLKPPST